MEIQSGDVIESNYRDLSVIFVVYKGTNEKLYAIKIYKDTKNGTICNVENSINKGQFNKVKKLANVFEMK